MSCRYLLIAAASNSQTVLVYSLGTEARCSVGFMNKCSPGIWCRLGMYLVRYLVSGATGHTHTFAVHQLTSCSGSL